MTEQRKPRALATQTAWAGIFRCKHPCNLHPDASVAKYFIPSPTAKHAAGGKALRK